MSAQPVVVITGASQGIGAGLVTGYRRLGYAVVANSRTITPSDDARRQSTRSSPNGSPRYSPRTRSSRVCAPIALAAKESSTITRANRRA